MNDDTSPRPLFCKLTDAEKVRRQRDLQEELCSGVQETIRMDDGFALKFPGERQWLERVAEIIGFERECCPFLLLELRAEPDAGPIWLRLRGPEGTVGFLSDLLGECGVYRPTSDPVLEDGN